MTLGTNSLVLEFLTHQEEECVRSLVLFNSTCLSGSAHLYYRAGGQPVAPPYSDGYIFPGSKQPQRPAGVRCCLSVGLVWASEVLGTCLGTLWVWYLNWEPSDMNRGSGEGERLQFESVAAEEYLAALMPLLVVTLPCP